MVMVDPIGTPLAALATAEQCVKLAARLRRKYNDYATAEHSLQELILILEYRAVTIENQVGFLQSVWSSLEARLQNLQNTLLHMLYHKLQYAIELVDAAIGSRQEQPSLESVLKKRGSVRKFDFAFSLKQCLQKTVDDLEKWHKMFDPTWYLISRISGSAVDASLQHQTQARSVSILKNLRSAASQNQRNEVQPRKLLEPVVLQNAATCSDLGFGTRRYRLRSGDDVIVDQIAPYKQIALRHNQAEINVLIQRTQVETNRLSKSVQDDIDRLSSTLTNVDPQIFGLLQCYGVVFHKPETTPQTLPLYDLLFTIPPGMIKPSSLRARFTKTSSVSLNVRLSLAQSLSNAVMFVHSSQCVHKNIKPEKILIFESAGSKTLTPFLLGFEKFRLASGETFKAGDSDWESNLYRHPGRQGLWPEQEYNMLHDVYSLGVVLLEIGMWTNFVVYTPASSIPENSDNTRDRTNTGADASRTTTSTAPSPGPKLSSLATLLTTPTTERTQRVERARKIHSFLIDLARNKLPHTMGEKYTQIVIQCLTCLDAQNPGLGDPEEFLDQDDVVVGVEFVESVIMGLHEISY